MNSFYLTLLLAYLTSYPGAWLVEYWDNGRSRRQSRRSSRRAQRITDPTHSEQCTS